MSPGKTFRLILLLCQIFMIVPARAAEVLPESLELFVGDSRVLAVDSERVAVGNGKLLTVSPVSKGQLVLIGQAVGHTVLQVWLRDGTQHRIDVRVTSGDLASALESVRKLLLGIDGVEARVVGQRIVLEGDSPDARARERAAAITALYPGVVLDFLGKVGWETMVHIDVRIVEFRRGQLRELGIRWRDDINGPSAGVIADFATNSRFRTLPEEGGVPESAFNPLPARTPMRGYLGISTVLDSRIRALEQTGEATLVAEPRLSCRSGGSARFVAGGEIPIPVINSVGGTDVEFREYGVILDVKPVVDPSGAVLVRIETELSQVDNAQRVAGVPGLLKRRSSTDINVRSGETVVVAGLINHQRSLDDSGLPAVSRVPVAGRLFGVRGRRSEDSELVIFLTPRIESTGLGVEPAAPTAGEASSAAGLVERAQRRAQSIPRPIRKEP